MRYLPNNISQRCLHYNDIWWLHFCYNVLHLLPGGRLDTFGNLQQLGPCQNHGTSSKGITSFAARSTWSISAFVRSEMWLQPGHDPRLAYLFLAIYDPAGCLSVRFVMVSREEALLLHPPLLNLRFPLETTRSWVVSRRGSVDTHIFLHSRYAL